MGLRCRPVPVGAFMGCALLAFAGCANSGQTATDQVGASDGSSRTPELTVDPAKRLRVKNAYLGVSCVGAGNFVGCDRVCLFISLPEDKPDKVQATLAGNDIRLHAVGWRSGFEGCLTSDRLLHRGPLAVRADENEKWFGTPAVAVPIRLRAVFRDEGRYAERTLPRVRLNAGYG